MILAPFCAGWLIFAASRWISRSDGRFLTSYQRPLLAETVSTCLVLAGAYPTLIELISQFLGHWTAAFGFDLSYPPLWGGLSLAAAAGTLVAYPFHLWMIRRGVIRWGMGAARESAPVRPIAWYVQLFLALAALGLMVAAVLFATSLTTG